MLINIDTSKSVDNSVINMFIMTFTRTYDKKKLVFSVLYYTYPLTALITRTIKHYKIYFFTIPWWFPGLLLFIPVLRYQSNISTPYFGQKIFFLLLGQLTG